MAGDAGFGGSSSPGRPEEISLRGFLHAVEFLPRILGYFALGLGQNSMKRRRSQSNNRAFKKGSKEQTRSQMARRRSSDCSRTRYRYTHVRRARLSRVRDIRKWYHAWSTRVTSTQDASRARGYMIVRWLGCPHKYCRLTWLLDE